MSFLSSRNSIIVLTVFTALVHLVLGVLAVINGTKPDILFILNGIGYLAFLYVTFWPPAFLQNQAGLIRWAFMGYIVLTIVMYFVNWGLEGLQDPLGDLTKLAEILLLIGLWRSK